MQRQLASKNPTNPHLTFRGKIRLTMHNVHYLLALMRRMRAAIVEDRYPAFLREFFRLRYSGDAAKVPSWAVTALRGVGVDLLVGADVEEGAG